MFKRNLIILSIVTICILLLFGLWYTGDTTPEEIVSFQTLQTGASDCVEQSNDRTVQGKCFHNLAEKVFDYLSPEDYTQFFQEGLDRRILVNCHEFMHYIGWKEYRANNDMAESFAKAIPVCNQGMYHGIVEEYIKNIGYDTEKAIPLLTYDACSTVTKQATFGSGNVAGLCFHGVGHGFMFITNKNLPQALDLCDEIPNGYSASCYTGVYMENLDSKAIGAIVDHPSDYYDPTDPTYPCRILKPHQQELCYSYEASDLINIYPGDIEAWFDACQNFPEAFLDTCYYGIGVNIPAPSIPASETESMCAPAQKYGLPAYTTCLAGVLSSIGSHYNGQPEAFVTVCNEVAEDAKSFCYQESGKNLKSWTGAGKTIDDLCAAFKLPDAIQQCRGFIETI